MQDPNMATLFPGLTFLVRQPNRPKYLKDLAAEVKCLNS